MDTTKRIQMTYRAPLDVYDDLKEIARNEDRSVNNAITVAIKEYIERKKIGQLEGSTESA